MEIKVVVGESIASITIKRVSADVIQPEVRVEAFHQQQQQLYQPKLIITHPIEVIKPQTEPSNSFIRIIKNLIK